MASLEEELLLDEQENQREKAFILEQLPQELKEKYGDDSLLQWMLDTIVDYYYSSGILETDDDEVDIDMTLVAQHVCQQAQQQGRPVLDPQEVFFVVQADLDFQEQTL